MLTKDHTVLPATHISSTNGMSLAVRVRVITLLIYNMKRGSPYLGFDEEQMTISNWLSWKSIWPHKNTTTTHLVALYSHTKFFTLITLHHTLCHQEICHWTGTFVFVCVCDYLCNRFATIWTVAAASAAYVWRDATDDIQYYGGFSIITTIISHSSALPYHCLDHVLW